MNLNKVYLIGRLTADPEMRSTQSGQTVTTIRLATNRVWNDPSSGKRESTEFHTIVAWGRLGEIANQYMKKGGLIMVEGRMQTRSWTDKSNNKRYTTEVVAENIQMGPRSAGSAGSYARSDNPPSQNLKTQTANDDIPIIGEDEPISAGVDEEEVKVSEKDIPF
jgi:single-strand DNA-binding protein